MAAVSSSAFLSPYSMCITLHSISLKKKKLLCLMSLHANLCTVLANEALTMIKRDLILPHRIT